MTGNQTQTEALSTEQRLWVYRMNDCEWWQATSLPEAMGQYLIQTGVSAEEAFDGERELTDEEMDRLKFIEDAELPKKDQVRRTFREELERRIAAGETQPGIFACTEY